MILVISPSGPDVFVGGVRKLYDIAKVLSDAGIPARVVRNDVPDEVKVTASDLLVVPEVLGDGLRQIAPGVPRVSLNQNAYKTFARVNDPASHPYMNTPELRGVVTVSGDSERVLRFAFPNLDVRRIRFSIDPLGRFTLGEFPRKRQVCYFARKRSETGQAVIGILRARGKLDALGWSIVAMDGMTDAEVATTYRESELFLSFSHLEGRGDPPLEAMACGTHVVGFSGFGGDEYADWIGLIPEDDVLTFVASVEMSVQVAVAHRGESRWREESVDMAMWVAQNYSRESEVEQIVEIFGEFAK